MSNDLRCIVELSTGCERGQIELLSHSVWELKNKIYIEKPDEHNLFGWVWDDTTLKYDRNIERKGNSCSIAVTQPPESTDKNNCTEFKADNMLVFVTVTVMVLIFNTIRGEDIHSVMWEAVLYTLQETVTPTRPRTRRGKHGRKKKKLSELSEVNIMTLYMDYDWWSTYKGHSWVTLMQITHHIVSV